MSQRGEAAVDQAANFSGGLVAAARRRERWLRAEANAGDEETRAQFREAAADLEARYPELEEIPIGGAEAFARERGHGTGARSPVHEGRQRIASKSGPPRKRPSAAPETPPAAAGPHKPKLSPPASRRQGSLRPTSLGLKVPGGGGLFWWAVTGVVGVSLLYVVLTSMERPGSGAKAVPSIVEGSVNGLRRFLSLADVFPASAPPPTYNEGPGSNVAKAAARLQAAELAQHGGRRRPGARRHR